MFALYWLNKELQRIIYSTREKALGMGKLDFWEESIENLYNGVVNKEPISVALNQAIANHKLPKKILMRVVKSYKQELENPEFPDYVAMEERCEMTRTTMILLHMKMLGVNFKQNPELIPVAEYAGRCLGTIDYIRQIPFDLSRHRLKMPKDICEKHVVNVRNLWDRNHGKPKEELYDVVLE